MACRGKVFVAVVVMFLGLLAEQPVTFVNGDSALIVKVCLQASNLFSCDGCDLQKDCGNCLASTPGRLDMDIKGLAGASINCAENESKKALELANKGWGSDASDELIAAYGFCVKNLDPGGVEITNALKSFKNGGYADAGNQVMSGSRSAVQCTSELKQWAITADLVNQITTLESIRRVSAGILKQIQ